MRENRHPNLHWLRLFFSLLWGSTSSPICYPITLVFHQHLNSHRAWVPSNFMANRRVPIFSLNNCAQTTKKTFMCPKFSSNPLLKYTQSHISTKLSNFLKLCLLYCQKLFALSPTIANSLKKIGLVGTLHSLSWHPTRTFKPHTRAISALAIVLSSQITLIKV